MPNKNEERRRATQQAQVKDMFSKDIATNYENECKRNETEPTFEGLIQFAISRGIVRDVDIKRYMTFALYPKALWERNGRRTAAVLDLEDILGVPDRQIWSWLKHLSNRYAHYRRGKK